MRGINEVFIRAWSEYMDDTGIRDKKKTRKREVVEARTAFAMAFYHILGPSRIAALMDKTHATIIHYHKLHDVIKHEPKYMELFRMACYRRGIALGEQTAKQHAEDRLTMLEAENAELRARIRTLEST